ncbi:beta strand repeat-containing protein [Granulicella paludicola]|uniref:beta strand repeat-containing protein n=1 Tax=Granulicella paludicola TaxID=474951 RepID=UPI0021DF46AB|nr:Ig-like domain repeat protein [Granulicella paludicola]
MPVSSSRSTANAKLSVSKLAASVFSAAVFSVIAGVAPAQSTPTGPNAAKVSAAYQNLPMQFEPNLGQAVPQAKFLARGSGYNLLLSPDRATFALYRAAEKPAPGKSLPSQGKGERYLQMQLLGANASAPMSAERPLGSYVNYLTGSDRSTWKLGVPTYAQARVTAAYPGIDVVYYGNQKQLEYDFVVAPGADAGKIRLSIAGASPVLASDGRLLLQTRQKASPDDLSFQKPVLYQERDGQREPVEGDYRIAANGDVSFRIGNYDHTRELVIDPIISYASYFGGTGGNSEDNVLGSAINSSNELYAVGTSYSTALPSSTGEFQTYNSSSTPNAPGSHDAFVTKFSADGSTILWSTFIGGTFDDFATAVAVATGDQPVVVGYTNSCGDVIGNFTPREFPVPATGAQSLCNPVGGSVNNVPTEISSSSNYDAYMIRLSSDGKSIVAGTFLGGSQYDQANAVAIGANGNVYVTGVTYSTQYAVSNQSHNQDIPAWPTDSTGAADVGAANFPTTNTAFYTNTTESMLYATNNPGYSVARGGPQDEQGFLTVLTPAGGIVYSTLIGGTGIGGCGNGDCNTNSLSVAVDANGIAYIGGNTSSAHWPVSAGALVSTCANAGATSSQCPMTGWVAAFDPTKSGPASLLFTTYMNGQSAGTSGSGTTLYPASDVFGMATDTTGNVVLTGDTNAIDYPTTSGTLQPSCFKFNDGNGNTGVCEFGAFLTKLSSTGSLVWSTYLGATAQDISPGQGRGVALDANNNVFLLASTNSSNYPVKNSIAQPGGNDAYIAELSPTASSLLLGTYLGSGGGITVNNNALALDSNLNAYFSGSQAPNPYGGTYLPVTANAAQKTLGGNADGFVAKMITQQQPSATALTVSPSGNATPTQTVQLTATVTTSSTITGAVLPTGTVTFLNGSTTIGTGTLNANGVATYSGLLSGGSYSLTAQYGGDTGFNGSTSTSSALTVSSANTTSTALTVSPASSAYGAGSTLTATVTAGSTAATSGTVSFAAGSVSLGSAVVNAQGVATLVVKPVVGSYSVVASYAGTYNATSNPTGYAASVSAGVPLTVTKAASSTSLATSAASVGTGASVMLTATVTSGATGTVTFYSGSTTLGTGAIGTNGTATLTTSFATANTYSLTATYGGDSNYLGSTSTSVAEAVVVPSFSVTASQANLTIARGATGATTLTFTPVGGYSGAITLACGTLPSKATCTFSPSTVTLAGAVVTDTLTIGTGTVTTSLLTAPQRSGGSGTYSAQILWLPASMLGLLGLARRRKLQIALPKMLLAGIFVLSLGAGLGAITGCSSGSSSTSNYTNATPVGSYSVPVTITGPSGSSQTVALTVVVQ